MLYLLLDEAGRVLEGLAALGGDVVVDGSEGAVVATNGAASLAKTLESLRRSNLVDDVSVKNEVQAIVSSRRSAPNAYVCPAASKSSR